VDQSIEQTLQSYEELMRLEPHGPDVFVGESWRYPWGRVYGGQVVAQALQAAAHTVDPTYLPHSLHGYFIRGGSSDEPIRFEVDRIRNGRSFTTRRVVARQSNGAILNLAASFHLDEGDLDIATHSLPDGVPGPDGLENESWTPLMQRRTVPPKLVDGRTAVWIRMNTPLPDDPVAHAVAVAYASDDVPYEAAASVHPDRPGHDDNEELFMGASLDHALWFHRRGRADEWQLHILDADGYVGNRGLATGQIFDHDGTHVASVAQEILMRRNNKHA
jgi:acyl-CoA thioesterase-2